MFAIVHCPEFYIQCERLFRPDLNGQALVIISNNPDNVSRIIASSKEAQSLGLVEGLQGEELEFLSNNTIRITSPNYELYADLSARFIKSLALLAPEVSACANDEALLCLQGLEAQQNYQAFGERIRHKLKLWVGISATIGIAPTKTLAKLATNAAQSFDEYQGVIDLSNRENRQAVLERIPVSDITGIGKKAVIKLSGINIHTALELSRAPKAQVRLRSSVVIEQIALELSGLVCECTNVDVDRVVPAVPDQAQANTYAEIKQALNSQIIKAVERLDKLASCCNTVTIGLTTTSITPEDPLFQSALTANLAKPANSSAALSQLATQLLESLWREGHRYHSLRLSLAELSSTEANQFGLFSNRTTHSKPYKQEEPLNTINFETLLCAENSKQWHDRRSLLSPSFTTKWGDILRVS